MAKATGYQNGVAYQYEENERVLSESEGAK